MDSNPSKQKKEQIRKKDKYTGQNVSKNSAASFSKNQKKNVINKKGYLGLIPLLSPQSLKLLSLSCVREYYMIWGYQNILGSKKINKIHNHFYIQFFSQTVSICLIYCSQEESTHYGLEASKYFGPKISYMKIEKIHKKFNLDQVFMHNFMHQILWICPLHIVYKKNQYVLVERN